MISDKARAVLAAIKKKHPDWKLTNEEREDFSVWTTTGWGFPSSQTDEEILALSAEQMANIARLHPREKSFEAVSYFQKLHSVASNNDAWALDRLEQLVALDFREPRTWAALVSGIGSLREKASDLRRFFGIIARAPSQALEGCLTPLTWILREQAQELPTEVYSEYLGAWDKALPFSVLEPVAETMDLLTEAVNHPAGRLVEGLLELLPKKYEIDRGIPEEIRTRLDLVLNERREAGQLARALVGSRLALLYYLDTAWGETRLIPLFDWSKPKEAESAWTGFLWSPLVRPTLWSHLKPHFLSTFDHIDRIGGRASALAGLLAAVGVDGQGAVSDLESRECLRKLPGKARDSAAFWVFKRIESAGDRAAQLWQDRIAPWLAVAWPKEPAMQTSGSSGYLAWATTKCGEAFPDAVHLVSGIVGPSEDVWLVLHALEKQDLVSRYPADCLQLINSLTPDRFSHSTHSLDLFLGAIARARTELEQAREYARLVGIVRKQDLE